MCEAVEPLQPRADALEGIGHECASAGTADLLRGDEVRFLEESSAPLSDRDRDLFLSLLDNPPPANEALKKAARKHKGHG